MRKIIKTRILWLSDIHISEKYFEKRSNELLTYFESFFKELEKEKPLDYIILSGDIAYEGTLEDYIFFDKLFFDQFLSSKHSNAKLLVVPGNHDIAIKDSINLETTINDDRSKIYSDRNSYLTSENKEQFKKNFSDYSSFFNGKSSLFPTSINSSYEEHKLYGYCIDTSKKILFILVNTAWFSLGKQFNTLLVNKFLYRSYFNRKAFANLILSIKDGMGEYGNQVIGTKLLEELNLMENLISKYPDFTILTIMHHPPNWLPLQERYSRESTKQENMILNVIINNSNFVLTGHEHVIHNKSRELIDDSLKTYHLKAGCFIEDIKESTNFYSLKHNRFSILEINNYNTNWLKEKVFVYTPELINGEMQHSWQVDKQDAIFYDYKHCRAKPTNQLNKFDIKAFLKNRDVSEHMNLKDVEKKSELFDVYNELEHFFYVSKTHFDNQDLKALMNSAIDENCRESTKKKIIHFIFKDDHLQKDLYNKLQKENNEEAINIDEERKKIFDKFYYLQQQKFDIIRNDIFSNLENNASYNYDTINNISLVIEIVPFWVFEEFCQF